MIGYPPLLDWRERLEKQRTRGRYLSGKAAGKELTMIVTKRMSQWVLTACLLVIGGQVMGDAALHMPSSWKELLQWRSSGGEGEYTAFFHWDSASSTIQSTAYTASGAMHHLVWWKEGEGHYTFKLDRAFERDGRRLKGQASFVFEDDGRAFRFLGEGLKLGGEKLDPLRDVFRKVSK